MRPAIAMGLGLCVSLAACGDDDGAGADAGAQDSYARYADVALAKGCSIPARASWPVPAECEDLAVDWIACIARDLTQCLCETDGDLNCEGSYKPNEGPALCVVQQAAYDACDASANPAP